MDASFSSHGERTDQGREFVLRLLWSQDRIVAGAEGLRVVHRLGPYRSTMEISRDTIRRIYVVPGDNTLRAETDSGPIVLSSGGSPLECVQVAAGLREELRVPEECETGASSSLPEGWQEIVTPEGELALVRDVAVRRKQAGVALGITLPLVAISLVIVTLSRDDLKLIPLAVMVCTAAAGTAWGTARLARNRIEWRIASGSLIGRKRSGSRVRDLVEASRLELVQSSDSDGDDWFALEAVAKGAVEARPSWRRPGRRTIERTIRDPAVPRRIGAWIAERTKLPFDDRTTRAAVRIDGERALAQLRETGAFGRRLADWIERVTATRRS